MRENLLIVGLAVLFCVPAAGAQAGVGNGTSDVPPGLIQARERTMAAIERQMQKQEQTHARKIEGLLLQLEEARLLGDFEQADKIQDKIDKEEAKHDQKMAKLQLKLEQKDQKFLQKMEKFRNRHGQEEEEEEPPPPPPSEEPVVD